MLARPTVLFLCTHNACRSQMAEAWARVLHGERLEAHSAGTAPGAIDPRAVAVMREAGVDLSLQRSKHLDEFRDAGIDWVVTVCDRANANCPVFPGTVRRLHVGFDDPPRLAAGASDASGASDEEQALEIYRRVRDEIRAFVEGLPGRLG